MMMEKYAFGIVCIMIFYATSAAFNPYIVGKIAPLPHNDAKSIVYILPYENCTDYWTKTYGDRIYYYAYGNVSRDREAIERDFQIIKRVYDTVILIIPAEDSMLYFKNMATMDEIAMKNGLNIIYAIFPGEKYGREDEYLENGSKMHFLVLQDMQYLASLNATYKIAVWYGWTYRCNARDIAQFYETLPSSIKNKYAVWLDEEYVYGVRDVYSYGIPHDVLFITEAYDRQEIQKYSCLYYNQMLITGYEGANSLGEWRENIERMLEVCKSKSIGIWIFYDIGDGAGEEYAAFINGSLADFNYNYEIPFQKGFSYAGWWNDSYIGKKSDESLRNLKETGTMYVSLITTWYQDDEHSTMIKPDNDSTPSDEAIIHAINVIHALGMKVMLKPHVDLYNGRWRGEIEFSNDAKWKEWFENYTEFIRHYARLAAQHHVEQFCIGCELVKSVGRKEWFDVIAAIREEFPGLITYAADWSNYKNVSFWNAVDFVGIDAYFELTDKNDPTMQDLLNAWKKWKPGIEEIHNETGKPVVFTEIGYRSIDGCNRDPWNWQRRGKIDLQEQADCYSAAFKTFWNEPWFYGFYWWMWWPDPAIGGSGDDSYTPYKKPAENVLKTYYLGINVSVKIEKPVEGHLYIFDRDAGMVGRTIIIGKITIVANASNARSVEFYIDDVLKCNDSMPPYQWQWNEFAFGSHEIKVVVHGNGNEAKDEMLIWKIF